MGKILSESLFEYTIIKEDEARQTQVRKELAKQKEKD